MRFLYKILSKDYGIVPSYKKEVRERLFIINTTILAVVLLIIFIMIYMIYFSDDIKMITYFVDD